MRWGGFLVRFFVDADERTLLLLLLFFLCVWRTKSQMHQKKKKNVYEEKKKKIYKPIAPKSQRKTNKTHIKTTNKFLLFFLFFRGDRRVEKEGKENAENTLQKPLSFLFCLVLWLSFHPPSFFFLAPSVLSRI